MLRAKQCLHDMFQVYRLLSHHFATAMNGLLGRDTQAQGMTSAGLALMDRDLR